MPLSAEQPFIRTVSLKREDVPSFDDYPFCIPAIRNLTTLKLNPKVTFLIGENGSGKSTLLEAIAVAEGFNPEGGTRNFNFKSRETRIPSYTSAFGWPAESAVLDMIRFFCELKVFYNVATWVDSLGFNPATSPYGPISLHDQSHGESFLTMFIHRFSGNGLYLLDEPEAALSPQRQLTFLAQLHTLVKRGSQFIIATHSPIIMAYPQATIYSLTASGIDPIAYDDTEHVRVTKAFLNRTDKMLHELFDEDERISDT